jgi:phosphohistidine phosphatase
MKRLTLMRHADARWKDAGLSDLERPLSRRGSNAAQVMARRLLELKLVPDLVLASPARRAQQTAEVLARELSLSARRVLREEGLYLAGAADLLATARRSGPRVAHLMIVAHNPGLSELAEELLPQGEARSLATAAFCSMAFDCPHWQELSAVALTAVQQESPPAGLFGLFA